MQLNDYKEGIKLYNSQNMSDQLVKDNFVVRKRQFDQVWRDISQASMEFPEQHYIIQGVRGSGKTTLLNRLAIEIKESDALQQQLIAVVMKEEEYGISSLFRLWERVAEELFETHPHEFPKILEAFDELEQADPKKAIAVLTAELKTANKKIVLFIDNLVELFDHFSPLENDLLREILTTNAHIRIVGGSAISLEAFYDNKSPYYQFFKVIKLQGLNKKDTITLLKKLAEYEGEQDTLKDILKNDPGKIESIRRLTGGIPRTIAILFNVLMEGPKGTTFALLEDTIDKTTPLYKHRMDDLSKQQKPIIDAIALNWDAISAKEIKELTRLESKHISAQLSQLEKQWLVEKINTDGKNKLYRLKERFFNIWYLMRYGRRKDRRRVKWLTQFMEIWCSKDDLKNRSQSFVDQLNDGGHPKAALWFANAILCSDHLGVLDKYDVREKTADYLLGSGSENYLRELFPVFDKSDKDSEIAELNKLLDITVFLSLSATERESLRKALEISNYVEGKFTFLVLNEELNEASKFARQQKEILDITFITLINLSKAGDFEEAYEVGEKYIANIGEKSFTAIIHYFYPIYPELVDYYEYAMSKNETLDPTPLVQKLYNDNRYKEAYRYVERLLRTGTTSAYQLACEVCLISEHYDEVIHYCNEAIKTNVNLPKVNLNMAVAYFHKRQFEKVLSILKQASDEKSRSEFKMLFALCYLKLHEFEKAKECFLILYNDKVISAVHLISIYLQLGHVEQLAWIKYLLPINDNSLKITTPVDLNLYINLFLVTNDFETAKQLLENYLDKNIKVVEEFESDFLEIFILFLAKDQTNLVDRWLREYDLQERFKPLYFALMHLMKDTYPNEYLRMGEELRETVEEILERIKETAEKYQKVE